jgi:lipopolysaccharide/colanic/teichoic acid biosynthesis glycosyltransferase
MIRLFDIILSLIALFVLGPILFFLFLLEFFNKHSIFFYQKRVGLNKNIFTIIKFRTMKLNTKSISTHLISAHNITALGLVLRRLKIDELPQLWNVLKGDMSLVGPRPCLLNQKKLILERSKKKIFTIRPGITGLAQISGINMSTPSLLTKTDLTMIKQMNLFYYFYYILATMLIIFKKK